VPRLLNKTAQVLLARVSDRLFTQLQFLRYQGRLPRLREPETFNEKVQFYKLYYRNPLLQKCADKFLVREYVSKQVGEEHLVPLLMVTETAKDLNFDDLPERFVLKGTHGSGWVVICDKENEFSPAKVRETAAKWLATDFSRVAREWVYEGLTPRLICEQFLTGNDGEVPWDYKFFCFDGRPRYIQVDVGRYSGHRRAIFDLAWEKLPLSLEYAFATDEISPPVSLEAMIDLATRLAAPFPFVRVDLYESGGKVFFGELTFYPGKGVERFRPQHWDRIFGSGFTSLRGEHWMVD